MTRAAIWWGAFLDVVDCAEAFVCSIRVASCPRVRPIAVALSGKAIRVLQIIFGVLVLAEVDGAQ